MDSKPSSFWSNGAFQKEGQWYCLDHGSPISINNICLVMGGPRQRDYPDCVQFEVSDDATHWQPVGMPQRGNLAIVNLSNNPIRARYVRFRIVTPRPNWLSICEFAVNRSLPPYVDTTIPGRNFTAYSNTADIGISRVMEVFPMAPQDFISLELPTPLKPEWIQLNMENPDLMKWGKLTLTLESGKKVQLQGKVEKNRFYMKKDELPNERITAVHLTNVSNETQEVKLTLFNIGIKEGAFDVDPRCVYDADISTCFFCSKAALDYTMPIPEGCTQMLTIGNAHCKVTNATLVHEDEHVRTYKLKPGASEVRITHPKQPYAFLNEVIFK